MTTRNRAASTKATTTVTAPTAPVTKTRAATIPAPVTASKQARGAKSVKKSPAETLKSSIMEVVDAIIDEADEYLSTCQDTAVQDYFCTELDFLGVTDTTLQVIDDTVIIEGEFISDEGELLVSFEYNFDDNQDYKVIVVEKDGKKSAPKQAPHPEPVQADEFDDLSDEYPEVEPAEIDTLAETGKFTKEELAIAIKVFTALADKLDLIAEPAKKTPKPTTKHVKEIVPTVKDEKPARTPRSLPQERHQEAKPATALEEMETIVKTIASRGQLAKDKDGYFSEVRREVAQAEESIESLGWRKNRQGEFTKRNAAFSVSLNPTRKGYTEIVFNQH
jgi:hypothetical protein